MKKMLLIFTLAIAGGGGVYTRCPQHQFKHHHNV